MTTLKSVLISLLVVASVACGGLRHVAVQVDATFAESVFALSDAAYDACVAEVFESSRCKSGGDVNALMQRLLTDVDAVTAALQDSNIEQLPKSLPDLLKALTQLQVIVSDLAPAVPEKADLVVKIQAALIKAIGLVQAFAEVA